MLAELERRSAPDGRPDGALDRRGARGFRPRPRRTHRGSSTMRGVAILTSLFPPSVGGIQTQTLALARGLAELGTEVHVVTRPAPGRPAREDGGRRHGPPRRALAAAARRRRSPTSPWRRASLASLRRSRVEVLHAHQLLSPATVALVARGPPRDALRRHRARERRRRRRRRRCAAGAARPARGSGRCAGSRRRSSPCRRPIRDELAARGHPGERASGRSRTAWTPAGSRPPTPPSAAGAPGARAPPGARSSSTRAGSRRRRASTCSSTPGPTRAGAATLGTLCLVGDGPERAGARAARARSRHPRGGPLRRCDGRRRPVAPARGRVRAPVARRRGSPSRSSRRWRAGSRSSRPTSAAPRSAAGDGAPRAAPPIRARSRTAICGRARRAGAGEERSARRRGGGRSSGSASSRSPAGTSSCTARWWRRRRRGAAPRGGRDGRVAAAGRVPRVVVPGDHRDVHPGRGP